MANQLTPRKAFENPDLALLQSDRFEGQHFERKEAPTREQAGKERGKTDRKLKEKLDRLRDKLQKTICSFAVSNEEPSGGLFVLGIDDGGDIRGLNHLSSSQLQSLLVTDSLLEGVQVDAKRLDCKDFQGNVNFIYLFYVPYAEKSLVCSADSKKRVWKRIDSHTIELSAEAVEQLKQDRGIIAFESQCLGEFSDDEIDHQLAERFRLAAIEPYNLATNCPLEDVLFHTGAIDRKDGKRFWTRAGFLFLAKNPRRLFPGAYIRLVKFEGIKSTARVKFNPTFDRAFGGPLPLQISRTREFIRNAAYLKTFEYRKNGSLFREPELPLEAWNEAIVNAVVHRSYRVEDQPIHVIKYTDNLVVESPGSFVQPMPKSEFRISEVPAGRSRPRNPKLMGWFLLLEDESGERYVKQWQEGIKTIEKAMKAAGKPEPTYKTNSEVALSLETNGVAIETQIAAGQPFEVLEQVSAAGAPEGAAPDGPSGDREIRAEIKAYREEAEAHHATLPVAGFQTRLRVPIDLEELYVPLRAMVDLRGVGEAYFADAAEAEKHLHEAAGGALDIELVEAFREAERRNRQGLVILGDPGAGKTTHLKRLLLWCLRKAPESLGLPEGMLPVFLPLRELEDLEQGFDTFIQAQLTGPHLETEPGFGRRLLARGNLLLLLDGLDEVADVGQRAKVARWIEKALPAQPSCRLVVTCRFAGYGTEVRLSEKFLELHLRPITAEQASRFVHNWYRIVERGLARDPQQGVVKGQERAEKLVARLSAPDFRERRVFELTRNPLLLANLCLVHRGRGQLPQKRADLYDEWIDVLLERWRQGKGLGVGVTAKAGRRVLQPLAYWLHGEEGRTRARAEEIAPVIEPALRAIEFEGGGAAEFLRTVRDESGLLTGWDQEHYGFMHLGFQEYLAACEIRRRSFEDDAVLRHLAAQFGESWWQEVSLLLLALEEPSRFAPFMREVVKQAAFAEHAELVQACLDDALEVAEEPFVELARRPPGLDEGLWARQVMALQVLECLGSESIEALRARLRDHPSPEVQTWRTRLRRVRDACDEAKG